MDIRDVQRLLASANYYAGAIDGVAGPLTMRGVGIVQRNGGFVWRDWTDVRRLIGAGQRILAVQGFGPGAIDGRAGPATRAALGAWAESTGLARLSWDAEVVAQSRPPLHRFGAAMVSPPPGAFLQATLPGEAALQAAVADAVGGARRIVDLFSGCGTFALPLATGAEVLAVETDAPMLAALDLGWRGAPGLRRVGTQARDLFRRPLLADELKGFDAAVIDPPRAGAEAQARALADSDVPVVAAVSCNPVTFARDARILCDGGFRLEWVQMVDQFRFSPHVELAARFTR